MVTATLEKPARSFFGVLPGERSRVVLIALLLAVCMLAQASNDIVATMGFVSNVGAAKILLIWAADALIVILSSGLYALVVDRMHRRRLAVGLFLAFAAAYVAMFLLFASGAPR